MRDILFRGKRVDNGEWVEGYWVYLEAGKMWSHRIYTGYAEVDVGDFYPDFFEVSPATIAQYTGLTDKNGKKIFEGDVMEFDAYGLHYNGVVSFIGGNFCIMCIRQTASPFLDYAIERYDALCVGNIHDNPELLEGE